MTSQTQITQFITQEPVSSPMNRSGDMELIDVPETPTSVRGSESDFEISQPRKKIHMSYSPIESDTVEYKIGTNTAITQDQFTMIMNSLSKLEIIQKTQEEVSTKLSKLDEIHTSLQGVMSTVSKLEKDVSQLQLDTQYMKHEYETLKVENIELKASLEFTQGELDILKKDMTKLKENVNQGSTQHATELNQMLNTKVKMLKNKSMQQREYMQRNNLLITGIPEGEFREDCVQLADDVFYNKLWIDVKNDIDKAHRLGPKLPNQKNPRPIIVRFVRHAVKEHVLSQRRYLANTGIWIIPHKVDDLHTSYDTMRQIQKEARNIDKDAKIVGEKLWLTKKHMQ